MRRRDELSFSRPHKLLIVSCVFFAEQRFRLKFKNANRWWQVAGHERFHGESEPNFTMSIPPAATAEAAWASSFWPKVASLPLSTEH